MTTARLSARLRRWPAILLCSLLVVLAVLWIDSYFHERHFIFLPGGDVGLGFATGEGRLHWVEYAPWSPDPKTIYWSKGAIPFFDLTVFTTIPFLWYVFHRHKTQG
jgi:hypothetical protein